MLAYNTKINEIYNNLNSSKNGLTTKQVELNAKRYGVNKITKKKGVNVFKKIIDAMLDPMLIILEIAFIITVGVNVGKAIKGIDFDFYESIGILLSITLSVSLTVIMEGKSQKAYELLNSVSDYSPVKVKRNGVIEVIKQTELVVGDITYINSGDKVFADGRIVSCNGLKIDESVLTGESLPVSKTDNVVLVENTPLADRKNMVFSGTFVTEGSAEVIITAVGAQSESGVIATELQIDKAVSKPLQEKLNRLSKLVTALGIISAVFVLILTIIKLFLTGNVNFDSVENAVLGSIILIVAAVPEGLPTTVAIALTLNLVKLSKQNALIRKLIATETVGCVSVICSDKTGTLTENKMKVKKIVRGTGFIVEKTIKNQKIINNICINSTADIKLDGKEVKYYGNITECALLDGVRRAKIDYNAVRNSVKIVEVTPFNSNIKYMETQTEEEFYIKGAHEVVVDKCNLTYYQKNEIKTEINAYLKQGARVICFASKLNGESLYNYDGFAVVTDEIRKDAFKAVKDCVSAGIKVKMLTGDNKETAFWVAKNLKIAENIGEVYLGNQIDDMPFESLIKIIDDISVVARSTPKTKLKIVNALKEKGEVVAVTGDGVNDAPAIKNADIGIAMGSGSEIAKEVSDIILLDDSFSTIISAIFFGRNIYLNFQRFIMFQLSVNLTAVGFIVASLILGLDNPFTTVELLWVNLIMDGPPALTLGLETRTDGVMDKKPVKRTDNIINAKTFLRILSHALIMCTVLILQYEFNFLKVDNEQIPTVIFTLFVVFNLFNAFNAREIGSESIFNNLKNNKLMIITFLVTFVLQILITQFAGEFFGVVPLSFGVWIKIVITASGIVVISELYKKLYKIFFKNKKVSKRFN